jgi:hypothetical protein
MTESTDIKPMRKGELAQMLNISYYVLAKYIEKIADFGPCIAGYYTPGQIKKLCKHIDFDLDKKA